MAVLWITLIALGQSCLAMLAFLMTGFASGAWFDVACDGSAYPERRIARAVSSSILAIVSLAACLSSLYVFTPKVMALADTIWRAPLPCR